ncbi:MAG: hypothetical protein Q8M92_01990, partial [Candidatus Subteraquimicrobiales bacterium]|nr:hypothetical protein [Candidatus Subteraquimicrobiales bacterium]
YKNLLKGSSLPDCIHDKEEREELDAQEELSPDILGSRKGRYLVNDKKDPAPVEYLGWNCIYFVDQLPTALPPPVKETPSSIYRPYVRTPKAVYTEVCNDTYKRIRVKSCRVTGRRLEYENLCICAVYEEYVGNPDASAYAVAKKIGEGVRRIKEAMYFLGLNTVINDKVLTQEKLDTLFDDYRKGVSREEMRRKTGLLPNSMMYAMALMEYYKGPLSPENLSGVIPVNSKKNLEE